jgi:hypothetical protein
LLVPNDLARKPRGSHFSIFAIRYSLSSLVGLPGATAQFLKTEGFMDSAIKTTLVGGLMLCSAMALAQTVGKAGKEEHHSRLAKVAFWRHHKDNAKNAKPALAAPAQAKQVRAKPAQIKGAPAKQGVIRKDHRQEQHAAKTGNASAKKAPAANKKKPRQSAPNPAAASLKQ